ncbi:MAG: hypothetical protein LBQ64_01845 [Bacteroidales bacterium]|jgi:peptidoglycan hydrolase CwlO-like protein|nr:hypothetical protein [Bacteroidales bacterium]
MNITEIISILTPVCTGIAAVAGWFFGRRKQKNDFLNELQSSIDLLAGKNRELMQEVVQLRNDNATLLSNQEQMRIDLDKMNKENTALRKEIEKLRKSINKKQEFNEN